jgi:hypothetical protein
MKKARDLRKFLMDELKFPGSDVYLNTKNLMVIDSSKVDTDNYSIHRRYNFEIGINSINYNRCTEVSMKLREWNLENKTESHEMELNFTETLEDGIYFGEILGRMEESVVLSKYQNTPSGRELDEAEKIEGSYYQAVINENKIGI